MSIFYKGAILTNGATSGKMALDNGYNNGDGVYWLTGADGTLFKAYCDMTTQGGGWTCVGVARGANTSPTFGVGGKVTWAKYDPWLIRTTATSDSANPQSTSSEWNPAFIHSKGTDIMIKEEGTGYAYSLNAWGSSPKSWREFAVSIIGSTIPTTWPTQPSYGAAIGINGQVGLSTNSLIYGTNYDDNVNRSYWYFYAFDGGGDTWAFLTTSPYSGTTGMATEADTGIGADEDGPAYWTGGPAAREATNLNSGQAYDAGGNTAAAGSNSYVNKSFSMWVR